MKRPWHVWSFFLVGLLLVLLTMGWFTAKVLELDTERQAMRRNAQVEERVRLSMWRMDSYLAPVIGTESARPYFVYNSFYPAGRAYTRMFAQLQPGEVLFPSPILRVPGRWSLLHFQLAPDGRMTSPQIPEGNMLDLAESGYLKQEEIAIARDRLGLLQKLASRQALEAHLPEGELSTGTGLASSSASLPGNQVSVGNEAMLDNDWNARNVAFQQASSVSTLSNDLSGARQQVRGGLMKPFWLGDQLVLARQVQVGNDRWIQGVWLDWPTIQADLVAHVADLLPEAALVAGPVPTRLTPQTQLASLPAHLLAGPVPVANGGGFTPLQVSLLLAWISVVLAAATAGAALFSAVSLSERRASFVSAVTHELRTPLTTFRMYTEMLDSGMVDQPDKLKQYFSTLHLEAERLGHVVENVLSYARLERNRYGAVLEPMEVGALLDRVQDRLAARAHQSGARWSVQLGEGAQSRVVRVDLAAVERILFNLVDNACKYGCQEPESPVMLDVKVDDRGVDFRVCDRGPGIPPNQVRRLFQPFEKAPENPSRASEGIGLGLALSRKLAGKMGGDLLALDTVERGACFILRLPAA